jgi:hypothetical protein
MRWGIKIWALFIVFASSAVLAQSSEVRPVNLAAAPCNAAETRVASVGEIAAMGDDAIGRCFTVEGLATGFWLYADNAARYLRSRAENDPSASGAVVGLYGRDRGLPPALVRVTGRIDRCERISNAVVAEGGIPFLSGYCHYYRGLALYGRRVEEIAPVGLTRIVLRDAGALGTLRPIAAGEVQQRLLAAASPFFNALDRLDESALRTLITQSQNQQENQIAELMAHPAVQQWRMLPEVSGRALAVLGWNRPEDASAEQQAQWARDAANGPEGYVCSAGIPFAEQGRWPISPSDTEIFADRPYLCVRIWLPADRPPSYSFGLEQYPESAAREPAYR